MRDLWEAGLDHVQVSIQDADAVSADRIAGYRGAFQRKHALAAEAVRLGLPLTINLVVHRANIERISEMVDLALKLKASRDRDRACAVLRLGAEEPRGADADRRAGLARGRRGRGAAPQASRPHRHRRRGAGLSRALPEALRRRLGPALAQRHAVGPGAAVPRRGVDSRPGVLERPRSFAGRHLGAFAGLQRVPRHGFPAGALRELRAARDRFRRLPLPGLPADRRRAGDRSGVPSVAASCPCRPSLPRCRRTRPTPTGACDVTAPLARGGPFVRHSRPRKTSPLRRRAIPGGETGRGFRTRGGVHVHFNIGPARFDCRRKLRISDRRRRAARGASRGFSPMDKTKPDKSKPGQQPQAASDAADRAVGRQAADRQDQAAVRLQGRGLVERPSRRPHHGDGRQGHDVHGHAA